MKLTREGAARLGRHESRGFPVGDFEFQLEDFDSCFALTIEEAKKISIFFGDVVFSKGINLTEQERSLWAKINKRIEQTEKP